MADEGVPPPAPFPPPAPMPGAPTLSAEEIASGKTMAILCYVPVAAINLICSIVCVASKNNAYSLYHAKQSLALIICAFASALISIPLMCIGIGFIMYGLVFLGLLVFSIMGIVNASSGQCKPLPIVGGFGEKWFKGVQKV